LSDKSYWKSEEAGMRHESMRKIYSHEEYIRLVLQSGQGQVYSRLQKYLNLLTLYIFVQNLHIICTILLKFMSMSQESGRKNTKEDSRMMAFFDALVQRDIVGLSEDESEADSTYTNTIYSTEDSSSNDGTQFILLM